MKQLIRKLLGIKPPRVVAIIPARMQSQRLPGKPVLPVNGNPMVSHVYSACRNAGLSRRNVYVATDHSAITDAMYRYGVPTVVTSAKHKSGTDRIIQAAKILKLNDNDIVINVQGDEPEMPPELIKQLISEMMETDCDIATLQTPIKTAEEALNPNVVKVITTADNKALLFSRAAVPYLRTPLKQYKYYRHVGIYGYTVGALKKYGALPTSSLEDVEQLEQLRALEHGMSIKVVTACTEPCKGIDTEEDYRELLKRTELS